MNTTLYADNDLQQEIIDDLTNCGLEPEEIETALIDLASGIDPLYQFFGMAVSQEHVTRTYHIFKDAIREELAALQDAGAELCDWVRTDVFKTRYNSHDDFAAWCLKHAIWNAATTLRDQLA